MHSLSQVETALAAAVRPPFLPSRPSPPRARADGRTLARSQLARARRCASREHNVDARSLRGPGAGRAHPALRARRPPAGSSRTPARRPPDAQAQHDAHDPALGRRAGLEREEPARRRHVPRGPQCRRLPPRPRHEPQDDQGPLQPRSAEGAGASSSSRRPNYQEGADSDLDARSSRRTSTLSSRRSRSRRAAST